MAFVEIYNEQRLVEKRNFRSGFYIAVREGMLSWCFGTEAWRTDHREMMKYPGSPGRRLTDLIRLSPISGYFFQVIQPNWTLKIDGSECPKGAYFSFDVCWSCVELIYRSYQFRFLFSAEDGIEDCEGTSLPVPNVYRTDIPDVDNSFPL